MTTTKLYNGAWQISAMITDPFYGTRLETQTYYGYTKQESVRQYKAHLISKMYQIK